ncbi:restriction endonuclease subunit S [Lactococcus lactis]|uniref:Restriction endonuclease subunit S n=2 Tax=Lactococcus lactis TaxID=1358 RepID=A0A552YWB7_9LACT|nr:restriction endonuclease subunit S [Lactococcus lactis]TRW71529.1 restriction endonuclease subunit S [Lactococcus lactis]TRW73624.1 restriction endonuclease subunit S [Lactococcus lactis]
MAKIDDSVKKKVPELRFPGFTDDWEERKAKEMIKTHHFRSYLAEPNDVGNYEVIQQGDKPIAGYANGEPFEYFYDVTLFGDHTVSLFKPTKPFFIATDGVKIISADEFDGRYFYVTLERYKPASQGYKRHFTILKNEDIWFTTNKDEQVKIGTFFKQLDETIALHQRKLDLLKEQKKGYLQKMFPKNGAKVPELRFAGFADDWEERKLSDIVSRLSKSSNNSELPRVEFEDIVSGEGRLNKDVSHKFDDRKGILFSSQNILYGKLRPYLKNWLLADFKGIALGDFWVFKPINSDPKFVYSLIQSNHYQKVANDTSGTKMPRSDWKKVSSTEFQIPSSLEEQKKIGSFFKKLDDTIALHQRKLDLLKEQKKGFLQKMFV